MVDDRRLEAICLKEDRIGKMKAAMFIFFLVRYSSYRDKWKKMAENASNSLILKAECRGLGGR